VEIILTGARAAGRRNPDPGRDRAGV